MPAAAGMSFRSFEMSEMNATKHSKTIIKNIMMRNLGATSLGILAGASILILSVGCSTGQKELQREAKVTEAQATKVALDGIQGGKVAEGELERENGRLVWSFDIWVPGTADIAEVQVDALDGTVVSRTTETPEEQAKEMMKPLARGATNTDTCKTLRSVGARRGMPCLR